MALCGCGSELLIPIVDPDGPIRLEGRAAAGLGQPALEVCPILAVRHGEGEASRLVVYRVRLDEPKAAANAMETIPAPERSLTGLALRIAPAEGERRAWTPDGPIPAQLTIELHHAEGTLASPAIAAQLFPDRRLTRKALAVAAEPVPIIAIITPLGLCFEIWRIAPLRPGWMLYTSCVGLCLPFFSCQCWSFWSNSWKAMCMYWVPCLCK